MRQQPYELQHHYLAYIDYALEFIQTNWFKVLLVLLGLYIILEKDISLQFQMQAAGAEARQQQYYQESEKPLRENISPSPVVLKSGEDHFGLGETDYTPSKAMKPVTKVKKTKKKKRVKDNNKANNFSNISAILMSDGYIKKHNIDKDKLREKRKVSRDYIKRYAKVAQEEMKRYGIPASITLAQGLLESDAGCSRLTRHNNNHFGIKCFSKKCRKGHCANFTDDTHKDFFRKYNNAWESFRAHSQLLQHKRYKKLKRLDTKDYKGWAVGLRKAGYATDKTYHKKLIMIIQKMKLYKYD